MFSTAFLLVAIFALTGANVIRGPNDGKIVGGEPADIKDFPYQVSLRYFSSHFCGASILTSEWVLTAAHCVHNFDHSQYSIRAGSSNRLFGGKVYDVATVIEHEKYEPISTNFDFALLKLSSPIKLDGVTTKPIALARTERREGTPVVVSGWGTLSEGGSVPQVLNQVGVNMIKRELCDQIYQKQGMRITKEMICAGVPNGGKDSCQGDSGGPLVDKSTGEQVGVVSWGIGCARNGIPGVYSNIADPECRKWITDKTGVTF